jgi:hypothetical protein
MKKLTEEQAVQNLLNEIDHVILEDEEEEQEDDFGIMEIDGMDVLSTHSSQSSLGTLYQFRTNSNTFNYSSGLSLDHANQDEDDEDYTMENPTTLKEDDDPFGYPDNDIHNANTTRNNNNSNNSNALPITEPSYNISNSIDDLLNEIKSCYESDWG